MFTILFDRGGTFHVFKILNHLHNAEEKLQKRSNVPRK